MDNFREGEFALMDKFQGVSGHHWKGDLDGKMADFRHDPWTTYESSRTCSPPPHLESGGRIKGSVSSSRINNLSTGTILQDRFDGVFGTCLA